MSSAELLKTFFVPFKGLIFYVDDSCTFKSIMLGIIAQVLSMFNSFYWVKYNV